MTISFTLSSFLISVMKKFVLRFFWLTVTGSPGRVSLAGAVEQFWRWFWSVWNSLRLEADDLVFSAATYEAFGSGVIPGVNVPTYSRHSGWVKIEGVPCGPDAGSGATFSGFYFKSTCQKVGRFSVFFFKFSYPGHTVWTVWFILKTVPFCQLLYYRKTHNIVEKCLFLSCSSMFFPRINNSNTVRRVFLDIKYHVIKV